MTKKKRLPKSLTTVTPLSKTIAFILFILMPFIGFYLGMHYQKTLDSLSTFSTTYIQAAPQK